MVALSGRDFALAHDFSVCLHFLFVANFFDQLSLLQFVFVYFGDFHDDISGLLELMFDDQESRGLEGELVGKIGEEC